jgi:hypothetical protein
MMIRFLIFMKVMISKINYNNKIFNKTIDFMKVLMSDKIL